MYLRIGKFTKTNQLILQMQTNFMLSLTPFAKTIIFHFYLFAIRVSQPSRCVPTQVQICPPDPFERQTFRQIRSCSPFVIRALRLAQRGPTRQQTVTDKVKACRFLELNKFQKKNITTLL